MTLVSLVATLTATPDTREELMQILLGMVAPTQAEPGCITYDLFADPADPCVFMFYENWVSQADLDAHMKAPHLALLQSQASRILACPVHIRPLTALSKIG